MKILLSKLKEHGTIFYRRLKHTCGNLSVHGPSFLVRSDVHIIFRLVYFIIYVQVWIAAVATIINYFDHYQENTIRFTSRTDYLNWNTTFASVTVCEINNIDKITMLSQQLEEEKKLERFIGDIAFFTGTCYSCLSVCDTVKCPTDFIKISSNFRSSCTDLFISCKWNDEPIDCCKHFVPIQTEYGLCFSLNNKHSQEKQLPYVASSNRHQMATLEIIASQDYEAFLHSPEDLPFWNMEYDRRIKIVYGAEATVIFSIMDVINEPEVLMIPPQVRQCRFSEELPKSFLAFNHYSYSVCMIQCRIDAQLLLCNCTHHLAPIVYKDRYCDIEGLKCLTKHYKSLRKLKVPGTNKTGLECNCLSSCTEPDYNVVSKKIEEPKKDLQAGTAVFALGNKPNQRVMRQVARTTLDLVVAMGNCFGLCFGGSLLSIVEVVYYLCIRKWKYPKGK